MVVVIVSLLDTAPLRLGGGYERFLLGAARFGSELGHRVRVVTPGPVLGDAISYATTWQPVGRHLSSASVAESIGAAELRVLSARDVRGGLGDGGVVYCKNEPQELAFALAARRRRAPLVVGFHSAVEKSAGRTAAVRNAVYASPAYRAMFKAVDLVHVLQPDQADWVSRRLRVDPGRIVVIGNGTDVDRFRPADPRPAIPFRVLFAGRLIVQKGLDTFLEAVALARRADDVTIEAVVRGDGALRPQAERAARAGVVEFSGFSADVAADYRRADLVVVPSRWEMFSLVPLEALSCGVPVLVSGIPAFGPLRGAAVTEFPEGDAAALAAGILAQARLAARDPGAHARLRAEARARAVREFDARLGYRRLFECLSGLGA